MTRLSRLVAVACVVVLSLVPAVALAAPAEWASVDITAQSYQQDTPLLLVSGQLPESAQLPAQVELAVPAGSELQWIGEILGGDPSADPAVQYTVATKDGSDIYSFTLTKARVAQVEVAVPAWTAFDGTNYTSNLKWTAWRDLGEVRVSERLQSGATIVQGVDGASLQPGDAGYSYYTKTVAGVKAGDAVGLSYIYAAPAAAAGTSAPGATAASGDDTVVLTLVVVVVVGAMGFALYKIANKMNKTAEPATTGRPTAKTTARKDAADQVARSGRSERVEEVDTDVAGPTTKSPTRVIVPAVIITGLLVVSAFAVANQGTQAKVVDKKITKSFGAPNPCDNTSIPVMAKSGVDLESRGEELLEAFSGKEGITDVTLDLEKLTVDVSFCESLQSDETLRQVLLGTGLVDVAAAAPESQPASATVDADGKLQTASVDTASGAFDPGVVKLAAGVPSKITFGAAAGCVTEVVSSQLGLNQKLQAQGTTVIELGALDPGTYEFSCAMGHATGRFVVE